MARGSRAAPRQSAHHDEDDGMGIARAVMIVEERVPGAGVLLDVVIHAEYLQRLPESDS